MGTNIDDRLAVHATCISNDFLDKYMADANGDYIKVYLFIQRHRGEQFEVRDVADALNLTDHDIERAVRYWEKQGIFSDGAGQSINAEICQEKNIQAAEVHLEEAQASEQKAQEAVMTGTLEAVKDDEEFAGILFVAKHVLPALPTARQVESLEYMYRELGMSAELIEFMLEYCAGLEKTSARNLETVAIDWHEQGITTVKQAKKLIRDFEAQKNKPKKTAKPNRFLNCDAVDVDYDSIAQKKVLNRMQNGTD